MQLRVLTLKPQIDVVEYGVTTPEHANTATPDVPPQTGWLANGVQVSFVLDASATGAQIIAAATADAIAKGFISS